MSRSSIITRQSSLVTRYWQGIRGVRARKEQSNGKECAHSWQLVTATVPPYFGPEVSSYCLYCWKTKK